MGMLRTKKEWLGAIGVVLSIAAGATLPIVLSASAGAHGAAASNPIPVAACSPPSASGPVAAFSPPCSPVLTAKPSTGLGDGQTIQIAGSGYLANQSVGVVECKAGATGPAGCDLSTLVYESGDGNGDFAGPYTVSRIVHIGGGVVPPGGKSPKAQTIDCAHRSCFLGAADISNFSVASFVPLGFDPSLPLAFTATVDHTGTARTKTGVATISGTVSCTRPLDVNFDLQLSQIYGRFIFRSETYGFVSCKTGTKAWSVHVPPGNGTFAAGLATADVYFQTEVGTSYRTIEVKANVHLTAK